MPTIPEILASSLKHYLSSSRTATELAQELEVRVQWTKNALAQLQTARGAQLDAARKRIADLSIELIKLQLELVALVAQTGSDASSRLNYVTKLLDPQLPTPTLVPNTNPLTNTSAATPSPAHTASGTAAVVAGLKNAAAAALGKLAPAGSAPAPAPMAAWPFAPKADNKLQTALAGTGILPTSKSTASATTGKTLDTSTRKVYVNVRKHPQGFTQPLGKRLVRHMAIRPDGSIEIGIGKEGKQGWTASANSNLSFLDFHIGHEKGMKVSLKGAVKYLESGVTDTRI